MMAFQGKPGAPGFNVFDEAGHPGFPTDEPGYTRQRLDEFHARPTPFFEVSPAGPVYPANSDEFINFLTRKLEQEVVPSLDAAYGAAGGGERAGFFLLFGGGLGTHIPELVERYDFVDLILCEDDILLFHTSLFVTDWSAIVEALKARGGRLFFVHAEAPEAFLGQIAGIVQQRHQALSEGTLAFFYRPTPVFHSVAQAFDELRNLCGQFNGWLSDELVHFRNSVANLAKDADGARAVLARIGENRGQAVAVVVGSGPSLDDDIQQLRAVSDRCLIISCGTALEALLSAGIRPDFHCELENVRSSAEIARSVAERFDLGGVTLLAATTVNAGLPALFERTLYFLREGDAVCALIKNGFDILPFSGRTAVCSAASFAAHIGCNSVILLGVDLAYREDLHHAEAVSVYSSGEHGTGSAKPYGFFDTPGNFRASVSTNGTWTFMRKGLEDLAAQAAGLSRFVNCSDGARVTGFEAERFAPIADAMPGGEGAKPDLVAQFSKTGLTTATGEIVAGLDPLSPFEELLRYWAACKMHRAAVEQTQGDSDSGGSFYRRYVLYATPLMEGPADQNPLKTAFLFFLRKALFGIRTRKMHLDPAQQEVFLQRAFDLFETVGDSVMLEIAYQIDKGFEHLGRPFALPEALDPPRYALYRARRDTGLNSTFCTIFSTDVDDGPYDLGKTPRPQELSYPDAVENIRRRNVDDFLQECHRPIRERPCPVCGGEISWNTYPSSVRLEGGCPTCGNRVVH